MKYSIIKEKEFDLKRWLKIHKVSERKFAKLANIDYSHLSRMNRGKSTASYEMWQKIKNSMEVLIIK